MSGSSGSVYGIRVLETLNQLPDVETELVMSPAAELNIREEPYDALNQVWAGGEGGIGTSNSPLVDVQREVHLGNGSFTWKITDLERKFNINQALRSPDILQHALIQMGVDAADVPTIVGTCS